MPLLLPIVDAKGRLVIAVNKLVFTRALTVYYSYQHPIAFYDQSVLYCRQDFWQRRRESRDRHVQHIINDVTTNGTPARTLPLLDGPFFIQLQEILVALGSSAFVAQTANTKLLKKPATIKRRVKL